MLLRICLVALTLCLAGCGKADSPAARAADAARRSAAACDAGDYELALSCAEEAVRADPESPGGWLAKADALLRLGRTDDAQAANVEARRLIDRRDRR